MRLAKYASAAKSRGCLTQRKAIVDAVDAASVEQFSSQLSLAASLLGTDEQFSNLANQLHDLAQLLGPSAPASAADSVNQGRAVENFFFDPSLQWDANGNMVLDPQGNPLPDNLWTQFVACQATIIKRLNEGIHGLGVQQSFGFAVACYTLGIRAALYPFVKGQLETTAKIQVLAPKVNEIREKYKDDETRLQQEVGMLYMDLQIDPLGAVLPLLLQLPVFWGLYRAVRRLAIVEYPPLKEPFLWIPSLFGPGYSADPSLGWLLNWQGPLIDLHPKIGWHDFGLFAILPATVFIAYKKILQEATASSAANASKDDKSAIVLQFFPYLLAFVCCELPQAMGIYIATNIASSVALTSYTKNKIKEQIPGYDEFVETGKWPPGVDPEVVLAKAFGVERLSDGRIPEDPTSIPECVFAGRADFIPNLLEQGKNIDEYDEKGIPASMYTMALNNPDLLVRIFELGSNPLVTDKKGNNLLHYLAGYGRANFWPLMLEKGVDKLLDTTNEDGQTPLDVCRVNLSSEKIADGVREVLAVLKEAGAKGKATTEDDEERYENLREQLKKEKALKSARSALMALASKGASPADAQSPSPAESDANDIASTPEASSTSSAPGAIADSLERVKTLDIEALQTRLGGSLSEEQLQKISERLKKMSPEELAAYVAGAPASPNSSTAGAEGEVHDEGSSTQEKAPAKVDEKEPAGVSLVVD
jgi:YidC/Oxa1 family membrane protein insertase